MKTLKLFITNLIMVLLVILTSECYADGIGKLNLGYTSSVNSDGNTVITFTHSFQEVLQSITEDPDGDVGSYELIRVFRMIEGKGYSEPVTIRFTDSDNFDEPLQEKKVENEANATITDNSIILNGVGEFKVEISDFNQETRAYNSHSSTVETIKSSVEVPPIPVMGETATTLYFNGDVTVKSKVTGGLSHRKYELEFSHSLKELSDNGCTEIKITNTRNEADVIKITGEELLSERKTYEISGCGLYNVIFEVQRIHN